MTTLPKSKANVGRKPSTNPKIAVQFYAFTSDIIALGGMESTREFCAAAVATGAENISKNKKNYHENSVITSESFSSMGEILTGGSPKSYRHF